MSGVPLAALRALNELVDVLGEELVVATLKRLLNDSRKTQLKANFEAGKRVFKRKPVRP